MIPGIIYEFKYRKLLYKDNPEKYEEWKTRFIQGMAQSFADSANRSAENNRRINEEYNRKMDEMFKEYRNKFDRQQEEYNRKRSQR